MRKIVLWAITIGSLALYVLPTSASPLVDYVYDGDTITLKNGKKVRLVQIDTPELSPAECYGIEAKYELRRLSMSKRIELSREPSAGSKDDFGRLLRYVSVNNLNLNIELVRLGAASPWFYKGQKGKFSDLLLEEAQNTKKRGVGLWAKCPGTVLNPYKPLDTGPARMLPAPATDLNGSEFMETSIKPGAFCSNEAAGKKGFSIKGIEYTCKVSASENRLRWRR